MNKEEYMKELKANASIEASSMYEIHKSLIQNTLNLPDFADYATYSTKKNILLKAKIGGTRIIVKNFSMSEAVVKLVSIIHTLSNGDINENLTASDFMYFVLENGENNLVLALRDSFTFYSSVLFISLIRNMMSS